MSGLTLAPSSWGSLWFLTLHDALHFLRPSVAGDWLACIGVSALAASLAAAAGGIASGEKSRLGLP